MKEPKELLHAILAHLADGEVREDALRISADEFAACVNDLNERLDQVDELLRAGETADAVALTEMDPPLVRTLRLLDFPERYRWDLLCRMKGVTLAMPLAVSALPALIEKLNRLENSPQCSSGPAGHTQSAVRSLTPKNPTTLSTKTPRDRGTPRTRAKSGRVSAEHAVRSGPLSTATRLRFAIGFALVVLLIISIVLFRYTSDAEIADVGSGKKNASPSSSVTAHEPEHVTKGTPTRSLPKGSEIPQAARATPAATPTNGILREGTMDPPIPAETEVLVHTSQYEDGTSAAKSEDPPRTPSRDSSLNETEQLQKNRANDGSVRVRMTPGLTEQSAREEKDRRAAETKVRADGEQQRSLKQQRLEEVARQDRFFLNRPKYLAQIEARIADYSSKILLAKEIINALSRVLTQQNSELLENEKLINLMRDDIFRSMTYNQNRETDHTRALAKRIKELGKKGFSEHDDTLKKISKKEVEIQEFQAKVEHLERLKVVANGDTPDNRNLAELDALLAK